MEKLFFMVYENKEKVGGDFFIERPENVFKMYGLENFKDWQECVRENNLPVLEPVFMTEEAFSILDEFTGF